MPYKQLCDKIEGGNVEVALISLCKAMCMVSRWHSLLSLRSPTTPIPSPSFQAMLCFDELAAYHLSQAPEEMPAQKAGDSTVVNKNDANANANVNANKNKNNHDNNNANNANIHAAEAEAEEDDDDGDEGGADDTAKPTEEEDGTAAADDDDASSEATEEANNSSAPTFASLSKAAAATKQVKRRPEKPPAANPVYVPEVKGWNSISAWPDFFFPCFSSRFSVREYTQLKLQHARHKLWNEVQRYVVTFLNSVDLSGFETERFLQVDSGDGRGTEPI